MSFHFEQAKRDDVHIMVGLAGPSGGGKSFSALRIARGLAGDKPFAAIDTEARRLLHYADMFHPWDHGELGAPFTGHAYLDAIRAADDAGYPVIVIDSVSHEYCGPGGMHDQHDAILDTKCGDDLVRREKLSTGAWKEPKADHARFVDQLLQIRAHLVLCFRARQAIEMVTVNGKMVVRPTTAADSYEGWLIETEHKKRPLAFELTLSFLMLPDRPGVPRPIKLPDHFRRMIPLNEPLSEDVGVELARWADGAAAKPSEHDGRIKEITDELLACADVLGNRNTVLATVAKNRRLHAADLSAHVEWLDGQLNRLTDAVQAREDEQIELPTAGEEQ